MTDKQPEALRLADALRALHEFKKYYPSGPGGQMCGSEQYRLVASGLAFEDLQNAAAELRRLWEAQAHANKVVHKLADQVQSDTALLRQALEALEWADNALYEGTPIQTNTQSAITALRERLGENT